MSFRNTLASALGSLLINRLRSLLTMVGIIIGVAAVIVLVGVGDGVKTRTNEELSRTANELTITKVTGAIPGGGAARDLIDLDAQALRDRAKAPHIADVVPSTQGTAILAANQIQVKSPVIGSTVDYPRVLDKEIQAGRWFTEPEERGREKVVVLGPAAVADLYPDAADLNSVVGSTVRIARTDFHVIGVLAESGWQDDAAFVPLGTARAFIAGSATVLNSIDIRATDTADVPAAKAEINTILDARHYIHDFRERDYDVHSYSTQVARQVELIGFLSIFTVAVAAISLIVGGIGVANIMLVSVTERTREIGIRKAIGAPRRAILTQFLTEATILTGFGGLVGAAVGSTLVTSGRWITPVIGTDYPPPILTPSPIIASFAVSLVIGLVAGGYPAYRAAALRPIEALRFE